MKHIPTSLSTILAGFLTIGFACALHAQTTSNDDFTQANDPNSWKPFDGACLTAGNNTGSIPACIGLTYYNNQVQLGGSFGYLGQASAPANGALGVETPDTGYVVVPSAPPPPPGSGALRFTNWYDQAGSIISSGTPFPTGLGLQVVFKTVSYHGDSGGAGGDGADGMTFFLMDGSHSPYDTGAFGGSLGYTCSNVNNDGTVRPDGTRRGYDGLGYAYLGLGIDEYGNFLNQGDNTASGFGYMPDRIGLRGAGSIAWGPLNALSSAAGPIAGFYPSYLPQWQQAQAVQNTCRSGYYWNYSNPASPYQSNIPAPDYAPVGNPIVLTSIPQLAGHKIANEAAQIRPSPQSSNPALAGDTVAQPITYSLKITQDGILSLAISYNGGNYIPIISKQNISASNGTLPATLRFGFTGSTGGSRNVHEILCFQAAPTDVAGTSVGVNEQEATKIAAGTQAYLAYYYPGNYTGRLTANNLVYTPSSQTIGITAAANWDAQCNLTGVPTTSTCESTGVAGTGSPQLTPAQRTMITYNGTSGVPFEWSSITTAQQNTLDAGDSTPFNANRLNYLRGDTTNNINTLGVGLFRNRDGILSDIIDSSPTWVGPPTTHYTAQWKDLLYPTTDLTPENSGTQSYAQYLTALQTRLNVVYAGANDGFMHGFRTGSFDVNGNYVSNGATPNDGQEVLAYMPSFVLNTIHNYADPSLDFSGSQYAHNYYVDATPDIDDVFYNGSWHTWLAAGLGPGGGAIFMLDVTNPSTFSESNASNIVMGEWSQATLGCWNDSGSSQCSQSMGSTYGTPMVRRLHDGKWALIFGNGFGSASCDAGVYIMLIDSSGATHTSSTYYLSTHTANCSKPNGIAYVSSADLDSDHITDYLYAGDLQGNVWRFDLTSNNESAWAASSTPLFTTAANQPITTKLMVIGVPNPTGSGPMRLMIDFGTGQKFPASALVPVTYVPAPTSPGGAIQSLYGVWDSNMASWNSKSTVQYQSLASEPTLTPSNLTAQTLTAVGTTGSNASYNVTSNPVCWSGSSTCAGGPGSNTSFGFKVNLLGVQEQVVFNPLIFQNALLVNTTIPAVNSPVICTVSGDTGYTIAINLATGGALGTGSGSFFLNSAATNTAGAQTNGTGTPFIAQAGGLTFVLTQSLGGASYSYAAGGTPPTGAPLSCVTGSKICSGSIQSASLTSKRLTWIERR